MEDLSLHVLDIVENSVRSNASLVEIRLTEDLEQDMLTLEIKDNGEGMSPDALDRAADPFYTSKAGKKVGLGLALLAQAAREADGNLDVSSSPDGGTTIRAVFKHSHPDRKPIGDMAATLQALVRGNPDVDFFFDHRKGPDVIHFDTREIKQS